MPAGQGHKVTAEPAAGGEGPPATKAAQTTTGSTTVLTDQKISTRKLFQLAIKAIFRPREPAARSTADLLGGLHLHPNMELYLRRKHL